MAISNDVTRKSSSYQHKTRDRNTMLRIVERSSNYFLRPRLSPSTYSTDLSLDKLRSSIIKHEYTRELPLVQFRWAFPLGHKRKPRAEAPKTKSRIKEIWFFWCLYVFTVKRPLTLFSHSYQELCLSTRSLLSTDSRRCRETIASSRSAIT